MVEIIGEKAAREFETFCPVCLANTVFMQKPNNPSESACMGCAVVFVTALLYVHAKLRAENAAKDKAPLDPTGGSGSGTIPGP